MKNNKPEYYNDLDKIYLKIWNLLESGLKNRDTPFHIPVFMCGNKNNFDCGIGFHPWFNLSKNSKIYSNNFLFLKKKKDNTFSKKKFIKKNYIDLNKYKTDTTFLNWIGKSKLTINKNLSINIKNKKNVSNLHVYSPAKKNFFCIEPVTNYRDAYYIKKLGSQFHGLKNLKPKKTFKASVEFEILN